MCLIWYPLAADMARRRNLIALHLFICIFIRPAHHWTDHGMWLWTFLGRLLPSWLLSLGFRFLRGTCEASMLHFHCHLKLIASYERVDTQPVPVPAPAPVPISPGQGNGNCSWACVCAGVMPRDPFHIIVSSGSGLIPTAYSRPMCGRLINQSVPIAQRSCHKSLGHDSCLIGSW